MAKFAGKMKYCVEHGLDFNIYKLSPRRIQKMIKRKYGIVLDIEDKDQHEITKEAQAIEYE